MIYLRLRLRWKSILRSYRMLDKFGCVCIPKNSLNAWLHKRNHSFRACCSALLLIRNQISEMKFRRSSRKSFTVEKQWSQVYMCFSSATSFQPNEFCCLISKSRFSIYYAYVLTLFPYNTLSIRNIRYIHHTSALVQEEYTNILHVYQQTGTYR